MHQAGLQASEAAAGGRHPTEERHKAGLQHQIGGPVAEGAGLREEAH